MAWKVRTPLSVYIILYFHHLLPQLRAVQIQHGEIHLRRKYLQGPHRSFHLHHTHCQVKVSRSSTHGCAALLRTVGRRFRHLPASSTSFLFLLNPFHR